MISYLHKCLSSFFSWEPAPCVVAKVTSLHEAVRKSTTQTAYELIQNGADVNSKDRFRSTPICDAIYFRKTEATCLLLYYGAELEFEELMRNGGYLDSNLLSPTDEDFKDITRIVLNYCTVADDPRIECYCHELLSRYSILGTFLVNNWQSEKILADLFLTIASQINPVVLLNFRTPFLLLYLQACDFSTSHWLKCLYAILEFTHAADFMRHAVHYNNCNSCFYNLIQAFKVKSVERRDRVAIIWIWLSLGAVVTVDDINMSLLYFGYGEELEALIYGFNSDKTSDGSTHPAIIDILPLEDEHNYVYSILSSKHLYSFHDAQETILKILTLFAVSKHTRHKVLLNIRNSSSSDWTVLSRKIEVLDNCPSLVELSRTRVRKTIKRTYLITQPYEFFEIIKQLHIPVKIKEIVLLKEPLYIY